MADDETKGASGTTPPGSRRGLAGLLKRNRALVVHWVLFVGVLGALVAAAEWESDWVNVQFARATARTLAWLLTAMGIDSHVEGMRIMNSVCRFRIIGECTAYYPLAIYTAAVLAFPSPWRGRILGVVIGVPTVLAVNQIRLLTLCYIYANYNEYFETAHYVVWQSLIIFFTVLLWILWVTTLGRHREA